MDITFWFNTTSQNQNNISGMLGDHTLPLLDAAKFVKRKTNNFLNIIHPLQYNTRMK